MKTRGFERIFYSSLYQSIRRITILTKSMKEEAVEKKWIKRDRDERWKRRGSMSNFILSHLLVTSKHKMQYISDKMMELENWCADKHTHPNPPLPSPSSLFLSKWIWQFLNMLHEIMWVKEDEAVSVSADSAVSDLHFKMHVLTRACLICVCACACTQCAFIYEWMWLTEVWLHTCAAMSTASLRCPKHKNRQ